MSAAKIHGAEYRVGKIFSNDFVFRIPLYQRPYSWKVEHAAALLTDLLDFIGAGVTPIDDLSPYFLGSVVLIKRDQLPDAEVVDGQQRLTTLTILLSALRSLLAANFADGLTKYLYEEGDEIEGTPNRYRLRLRERDEEFFRKYVQDEGQIAKLRELDDGQLTDSQGKIRDNANIFLDRLEAISESRRVRLAQFIAKQCLLVVVTTPDLDSAYRIFSILNDRGMDLSHADILKAEIVGKVPPELQEAYTTRWEDTEDGLGREAFDQLFAHTRMVFNKAKQKKAILAEFREHVVEKVGDPRRLIDDVLIPFAEAFTVIRDASYESAEGAEAVNAMLRWLNRLENADWVPPAIAYLARNKSQPKLLRRFLTDLERLAAHLVVTRVVVTDRVERYGKVLHAFDQGIDLFAEGSPLQLSEAERKEFLAALDGDLYRSIPRGRLYVLLRLDSALSDASATFDYAVLSIEHVLPQTPPAASEWTRWFPDAAVREGYVHRLGNLLLLNRRKNSSANNAPFAQKKTAYFDKGGVCPFPLTTQALKEVEWTEEVVKRRQDRLLAKLRDLWRL